MCNHTKVTQRTEQQLVIPQGWEKLQEKENIDLSDYIQPYGNDTTYICEDCGKEL